MYKLIRFNQVLLIGTILFMLVAPRLQAPVEMATPQAPTDIGTYVNQVNDANLTTTVTALVGYGPRLVGEHYVYTDASCTYGGTYYDVNNLDRAATYAQGVLNAMGYTAVLETVPGYGHNVVAYKTGTVYPNTYIEFGAHLDTKPGTPGANDNASGSAAVMEIARVLKDYPSRYSMTFALWVGEETGGFAGSYYHIDQMLAAGRQIKAGLNMDNMGQLGEGGIYRNDVWTNNAASLHIYDIFNLVNTQYSLGLNMFNNATPCTACSDHYPYWQRSLTAVTSVGGWWPSAPTYHQCTDVVVANFNPEQAGKVTRQNLAVGLNLDLDIVPPTVTLSLSRTSMPADGSSTAIATATVTDGNGNPLRTETVTFTTNDDITISYPVTNNGDGTYSVTLTASTTTGPETITATDSGVSASAIINETSYCPGACFTDTTVSDYTGGTPGPGTYLSETTDGEVILAPTVGSEFSGSSLPSGWDHSVWGSGGSESITFSGGKVSLQNAKINPSAMFGPGRTMEFAAVFGGGTYQFGGFSDNGGSSPWAGFDFDFAGTTLTANENNAFITNITGSWTSASHRYRVDWNLPSAPGDIVYYIDGVEVARHTHTESGSMRPMFTDYTADTKANQVDWVHMSPYASSGTFESRIFDSGSSSAWGTVTWTADTPTGTSLTISARGGNTPTPDGTWSSFAPVANGASIGAFARYVQYRAVLSTTNVHLTPSLSEISLRYTPGEVGPATKLGFLVQPGGAIAGSPFTTQPVVAVQDANGYTVTTDNSTQVTLAIGTNPSGGTLTCTTNPVTVVNGVASFAGCRISNAGAGYTLTASGGSLTSATSAGFNVTQVAPAFITLSLSPDTIPANHTATAFATATVQDASHNPLPGETVIFSTNGDVTFGPVSYLGDGNYRVTITASTTPGDETITATDGSLSAHATLHETANCPGTCVTDTAASDFLAGTPGSATYVAQTTDGELILAPTVGAEFYGTTLPSDWEVLSYGGGSPSVSVSGGKVSVGTARLRATGLYAPGHVLEYVATYTGGTYQAGGLGYSFDGGDGYVWATFDTAGVGTALNTNTNSIVTPITGSWLNTPHRYRIEWASTGVTYFIDGTQVKSDLATFTRDMRPIFADNVADTNFLQVDWARMSPYASTGTFLSRVFDGGGATDWGIASWTADTPAGTGLTLSVHSGNTPTPDGTWTSFTPMTNGSSIGVHARYVQYQAELSTTSADLTPVLKDICISYSDNTPPTIINRSPAPGATNVAVGTNVTVDFSESMLASTITTSSFRLRAYGATSDVPATVAYAGTRATLTPNAALALATQYQVTMAGSVSDVIGNQLGSDVIWSFTTGSGTFTDDTTANFGSGTFDPAGIYVSEAGDGEIILTPMVVSEFSGTTLPTGWTTAAFGGSPSSVTVTGGWVNLVHAWLYTIETYSAGRSIEFVANMGGGAYQSAGFTNHGSYNFAIFNFNDVGTVLRARYNDSNVDTISGTWQGSAHRYRIEWATAANPGQIRYYIDGELKATQTLTVPGSMGPSFSDYTAGLGNHIDWVRMSPYASSGTFTSRIFDAGRVVDWTDLAATMTMPSNTSITFETQTRVDDTSPWSGWQAVNSPIASPDGRYLQYRVTFTTGDTSTTPTLKDVTISYTNAPTAVTVSSFTGSSHLSTVQLGWETASEVGLVGFNLYRSETLDGAKQMLNAHLIPAQHPGQMLGAAYQFTNAVDQGQCYYYWLELVRIDRTELIEPVVLDADYLVRLPILVR